MSDVEGLADSAGGLQRRAARGALWTLVHVVVSLPLAFAVNLVVARHLGVVDFGRLALFSLAVELATLVGSAGVSQALIQFGAKAHAAGREGEVVGLIRGIQGYYLLVQFPLLLLTTTVVARAADLPAAAWAWVAVFGVLLPTATATGAACLGIENRADRGARLALAGSILASIASVAVVVLGGSAVVLWATRLVISGLLPVVALALAKPAYRRAALSPAGPWRLPRRVWRFVLPTAVATVVGGLVSTRSELLVLQWLGTPQAAGLFALSFGLAGHLAAPAQALVGPIVPAVAALREVSEVDAARALGRTLRVAAVFGGATLAVGLPLLGVLVPLLYGAEYAAAAPLFVLLASGAALSGVTGILYAFVQARLAGRAVLAASVVALVVDVVLAVALVPLLEQWGAALALVSAATVQLALLAVGERRATGLARGDILGPLLPLVAAMPVGAGAWWLGTLAGPVWLGAAGGAILGLGAWVLLVRSCRRGLVDGDARPLVEAVPSPLRPALAWGADVVTVRRPPRRQG